MVWGAIVGLAEVYSLPLVQPSPQEIKQALCGRRDASKLDVEKAVTEWAEVPDHVRHDFERRVPKSQRNHAFDALGAVAASARSDIVRAAMGGGR